MSVLQLQELENAWQAEINKGDSFFQSSAFLQANNHYMNAMVVSELLLQKVTTASRYLSSLPGMYFTACTSIAHTFWIMQDLKNAASYFLYCTYKMKKLTDALDVDALIKEGALLYWRKAVQVYSQFSEQTATPILPNLDKDETYLQLQKVKDLFSVSKESMN